MTMAKMGKLLGAGAAAIGLAAATSAASAAGRSEAAVPSDVVLDYQGRDFACAGVGNDSQNNPAWAQFPLKMVFTNAEGDYLGDVRVAVTDSSGKVMVVAECAAPWFLAELEDGSYRAEVTARDRYSKSVDFSVGGEDQTRVVVRFPQITGT